MRLGLLNQQGLLVYLYMRLFFLLYMERNLQQEDCLGGYGLVLKVELYLSFLPFFIFIRLN